MDSELPTTFLSQSRFHQTCIRSKRVDLSGPICMWGDPFYSLNLGNRSSTRKTQVHHSSCRRKVNSLWFFFLKVYFGGPDTYSKRYSIETVSIKTGGFLGEFWMCQTDFFYKKAQRDIIEYFRKTKVDLWAWSLRWCGGWRARQIPVGVMFDLKGPDNRLEKMTISGKKHQQTTINKDTNNNK